MCMRGKRLLRSAYQKNSNRCGIALLIFSGFYARESWPKRRTSYICTNQNNFKIYYYGKR